MSRVFIATSIVMCLVVACSQKEQVKPDAIATLTAAEEKELHEQATALFGALPTAMPGSEHDTPAEVALGKLLFHDVRLSENQTQSCNTCHNVISGGPGVDNQPTSPGAFGKRGVRNSPTVLNAGFQFVQFWDGRAADLIEQAKGPVMNPVEMAMPSEAVVIQRLSSAPEYTDAFARAFPHNPKPLTYHNMAKAIAAFERTLISRSRFDDYVGGDMHALTPVEKRGLSSFIQTGCITCHSGVVFGGNTYQKIGLVNPYPLHDAGRYEVTKDVADSAVFKVPMLRNIAVTSPYFHDGSVPSLAEAVRLMAWHQLGKKLDSTQVTEIVAFLGSLTGTSHQADKTSN